MRSSKWLALSGGLLGICLTTLVVAHPDDPKERDRQPRYEGPGYRRDVDGIAGPPVFDSLNVELLSWLPLGEFGTFSAANDCWGYISPSGKEYAIIGLSAGTGFVDITEPGNAQVITTLPGPSSTWRDIKVYQHYAYAVSEGGSGIQVFDLSQIESGTVTLVNTITSGPPIGNTAATHNVAINTESGYLYRCGGSSNGLRIYSLANPANPTYVASWADRYVHDCQVVNYTSGPYAGKEIAFCCAGFNGGSGQTGLSILDVTNKLNITLITHYQYPNGAYSHQGWLSEDRNYFYLDDELDEQNFGVTTRTHVIDVSNLANPVEVSTFTSGSTAIDHNMYVRGNLIFQANYRSGLRVFDNTNPTAPEQIAYFDTYPGSESAQFNGLWSNFPFFPSGTVIGSDIERGLFVWQVGPPALTIDFPNGHPELLNPAGDSIAVTISEQGGNLEPGTEKLHYSTDGSNFTSVDLVPGKSGSYEAVFPSLPCGETVNYYISAQTTIGATVRSPSGAPGMTYSALAAAGVNVAFSDTLETNTGWTVGAPGDNATTGLWERVNPNGTGAQPEDDHTPAPGVNAWITGQGSVGGAVGENDVDGGTTTLTSQILDATGGDEPQISYWRWYSNNMGSAPNEDSMPIQISNNNGASWVQLELVTENAGTWVNKSFRISDFVVPTNQIRLRFIARDLGAGSIVEAGVDDVEILYYDCGTNEPIPGDATGDGLVNVDDLLMVINLWGPCPPPCDADFDGNGSVNVDDLLTVINNWS